MPEICKELSPILGVCIAPIVAVIYCATLLVVFYLFNQVKVPKKTSEKTLMIWPNSLVKRSEKLRSVSKRNSLQN